MQWVSRVTAIMLAGLACAAGLVACGGESGGIGCAEDWECARRIALPGPCWTARCEENRCVVAEQADGAACDDGNPCTTGTSCAAMRCEGGTPTCDDGIACSSDLCDPATGACSYALDDAACYDDIDCTLDLCQPGVGCTNELLAGLACDDGNPCTSDDRCLVGGGEATCEGTAVVCQDDPRPCYVRSCVEDGPTPGCQVRRQNEGVPCDGDNRCLVNTACDSEGRCVGEPRSCTTDDPCLVAYCDPDTGCGERPVADGLPCDDGDPCSQEECRGGVCTVVAGEACDDDNPCTEDICELASGRCRHEVDSEMVGEPCSDRDACTAFDRCDPSGTCVGFPLDCNDGDPCTADACDAASGECRHAISEGASCDDGALCTVRDRCGAGGECAGEPLPAGSPCRDDSPCTALETCDGAGTCEPHAFLPLGTACDDGRACTVDDACDIDGACAGSPASAGSACTDGSRCATGQRCDGAGACTGAPVSCDDDQPCTLDACDASSGACVHAPLADGSPCDASGLCSSGPGACDNGVCETPAAEPDGTACDDGNPCTTSDMCRDGACVGQATTCDDADPCTLSYCDVSTGACEHVPVVDGSACRSPDPCAARAVCRTGDCVVTERTPMCCTSSSDCPDDGLVGTTERCDLDAFACGRSRHDCFRVLVGCTWQQPSATSSECQPLALFAPGPLWVEWLADGVGASLWSQPPGSWAPTAAVAYAGSHSMTVVGEAASTLELPPISVPPGVSLLALRVRLDDDRNGCATGELSVVREHPDGAREVLDSVCSTTGGFSRLALPVAASGGDELRVRLEWSGGPERVYVDDLRVTYVADSDCATESEYPATLPADTVLTEVEAVGAAAGRGGMLVVVAGEEADGTRVALPLWSDSHGDMRYAAAGAPMLPTADESWLMGRRFPVAVSPDGTWVACPASAAGMGLVCWRGGGNMTRAVVSQSGAMLLGGALLEREGGGWWVLATSNEGPLHLLRRTDDLSPADSFALAEPAGDELLASPVLVGLANGSTLALWREVHSDPERSIDGRIVARLVSADGPLGNPPEALVTLPRSASQDERSYVTGVHAASLPSGGVLVLWTQARVVGGVPSSSTVLHQTFDESLDPLTNAVAIASEPDSAYLLPRVAAWDNRHALASWMEAISLVSGEMIYRGSALRLDPGSETPLGGVPDMIESGIPGPLLGLDDAHYAVLRATENREQLWLRRYGTQCAGYPLVTIAGTDGSVCVGDRAVPLP